MQRILFTCLVLVLLLAGCAAPGPAPEIKFAQPQVTPPVTPRPGLTATVPAPVIEFALPQVTPQVTPRAGWTVTYKLELDILFQHPLELQRDMRNGAPYEFAGPNGSYLHFNDISGQDAILGDTAEETCQKELANAAAFEKKLGSKPYGNNPQLINLQIDQQPACLILPSMDQRADFQKRALLVVAYPAKLFLEPGTPRYLSVTADSEHIQSIAETIRFVPRGAHAVENLPPAAAFAPKALGSLTLKNQTVGNLVLDDTYLYWTVYEKQDTIFRAPLNGGASEEIITAKWKDGDVAASTLIVKGDWLVYLENENSAKQANWELRARNLRDGSEQVVLKGGGVQAYPVEALVKANLNISVDQDWLAWSRTVPGAGGSCDESVLGLSSLRTSEQIELERVCSDQFSWGKLSLSGQTLVAEQDLAYSRGTGRNLYIFDDFHSRRGRALTDDGRNSMPGSSDGWIVWENASDRFGAWQITSVYERGSKTQRTIRGQGVSPFGPKLSGQWLYWPDNAPSGGTTLYDLKRGQTWLMSAPQASVLSTVTVAGSWIAWSRRKDFSASGDSVLEWAHLP